jgi:hypothetical protein
MSEEMELGTVIAVHPQQEANIRKPAKAKRAYTRKPVAATPAPKKDEFEGIDDATCCAACDIDRCVITGINVCGHPRKGGLQARQMMDRAVVERYARVKKRLKLESLK